MAVKQREMTGDEIMAQAERDRVRFITLQFTDIVGHVKSVTVPLSQLEDAITHGKWFDGSSVEGFARIAESDMYLKPDLSTFAVLPWTRDGNVTARLISWVYTPNGEPFAGDPRNVLKTVCDEAADMGFRFNTGPELEFFLLVPDNDGRVSPLPHDRGTYFDLSTDLASEVRKEMVNALEEVGIEVETDHHEVAMGQHEIDFRYDDAIRTADNAVTFKYTLKAIAQRHGLHATFMPKPIFGINGSGMHCHQSLAYLKDGSNAFAEEKDEYGLSTIAKQFIAGQLAHARGMCAVLAPLVNSYKRLVPGYEAPVYISWARVNRSALIRIPQPVAGKPSATRIELRCPDPSCNPYLAFAVMLKCGLDGIKRGLTLPPAVEENLYHMDAAELRRRSVAMLPSTISEAVDEFERDEVVQSALGEHLSARFIEAKRMEWDEYRMYVSHWELDKYLETY